MALSVGTEAALTSSLGRSAARAEKMVTFEDDLKSSIATATNATAVATSAMPACTTSSSSAATGLKLNADDVFM